jgi:plasmid stabilization system protein ParE
MISIIYSERFKVELDEIMRFLKKAVSVEFAYKTFDSILSSIRLLQTFPAIGRLRACDVDTGREYHLLVTGHYFIYYSYLFEEVRIDGIKDVRNEAYHI